MSQVELELAVQARLGLPTLDPDSTPSKQEVQHFLRAAEAYLLTIVPPASVPEAWVTYDHIGIGAGSNDSVNYELPSGRFGAIVSVQRNGVECAKGHVTLAQKYTDPKSMYFATPSMPVWWMDGGGGTGGGTGGLLKVAPPAGIVNDIDEPTSTETPFRVVALGNPSLDIDAATMIFDRHLFEPMVEYAVYCAYGQLKIPGLADAALTAFEKATAAFIAKRPVL